MLGRICTRRRARVHGRHLQWRALSGLLPVGGDQGRIVLQVFGANTDVGKTIISAGLCRAASAEQANYGGGITYIKPLQTGGADADFVRRHAGSGVDCRTLFEWNTPVSPHLAAQQEGRIVSSEDLLSSVHSHICEAATKPRSVVIVETAGGVLSPGPSSAAASQADIYRHLRLPVLLVGDGRLGGISGTIAAMESLLSRGYAVDGVVMLEASEGPTLDNGSAVQTYITETLGLESPTGAPYVMTLDSIPADPKVPLDEWFRLTSWAFDGILKELGRRQQARVRRLKEMKEKAARIIWYPFTQHQGLQADRLAIVDSAYGDRYTMVEEGQGEQGLVSRPLIDGCASWWTQGLGHGRPDVSLAVATAAGQYGHVIFPGNVHEPALRLAELALEGPGRGWATRVFFSDNGSTAMEIALKMALKASGRAAGDDDDVQLAVVTQRDCYHGDTLGCMDVAAPTVFNMGQHPWYAPRALSLAVPTVQWSRGKLTVELPKELGVHGVQDVHVFDEGMNELLDVQRREGSALMEAYRSAIRAAMEGFEASTAACEGGKRRVLGAVMMEPVLMGAAGMVLVDPLFQRALAQEARARRLPLVYDEVASGLYRLGRQTTVSIIGVEPDIACYGKTLTGGYLPLALTLTNETVFDAFKGDKKSDALLHGHSYTANPLACAAAIRALEAYAAANQESRGDLWDEKDVAELSLIPDVRKVVSMGTVLAVELTTEDAGYASSASARVVQELRRLGVYARPLGNVVYLLASQISDRRTAYQLYHALKEALKTIGREKQAADDVRHDSVVI